MNPNMTWSPDIYINCNIVLTVCLMNLLQNILVTSCFIPFFPSSCATNIAFEVNEKLKREEDENFFVQQKLETKTTFFSRHFLCVKGPFEKLEWVEWELHVLFHCCLRWFWIMKDSKSPQRTKKLPLTCWEKRTPKHRRSSEKGCEQRNSLEN